MKRINLLPKEAQRLKDVRRGVIVVAAVQAAIFLAGLCLYPLLASREESLQDRINEKRGVLAEISAGANAPTGANFHVWHEEFLSRDTIFNIMTLPEHVIFESVRFGLDEVNLVCRTKCISNIESHEYSLRGVFQGVTLVRVASAEDGYFLYEFRIYLR